MEPRASAPLPDNGGAQKVPPPEPPVVRFDLSVRTLVIVVLAIGAVWMVIHLLLALLVLITAFMLVGALNPFVSWLEKRKISRGWAIGIVFATLAAVTLAALVLILPSLAAQVKTLAEKEPEIRAQVIEYLGRTRATAPMAEALRNLQLNQLLAASKASLLALTTAALAIVSYSVGAIFLGLYIMIDRDRLRGALFAVIPRSRHMALSRILLNLGTIVGGYIRGQVITCALMTLFILVLLLICRVPNALAIAAFGGLMDLLPYIGIVLTMVPAVLAAFSKGPAIAATVFVLMFVYEEFEGRILVPLVYGRALRLPSSIVFFSLIAGYALAGIVGALLALPVASAILMLIDELRVDLPGETVQPEDVTEMKKDQRTEKEYEQQAQNLPAEEAAAVAVKISQERKEEEQTTKDAKAK